MHLETVQKMLQGLKATPTYGMVARSHALLRVCDGGAGHRRGRAFDSPDPHHGRHRPPEGVQPVSAHWTAGLRAFPPLDYGDSIGQLAAGDINYTTNIVAQLETVQAVERIDEIVKSDFIDMFFIGPGDLSMDMGIFGQFSNPRLTDTILMLRQKTAAAGKRLGVFAGSFDAARNWLDKDFDMVIVNSELAI